MYLWPADDGKLRDAAVTRLVVPPVEGHQHHTQQWHLSLVATGKEPGVFLISADGMVFCWPVFIAGSTPITHALGVRGRGSCTVVRCVGEECNRVLVGTSGSTLFEVELLREDLTVQSRQLTETKSSLISEGAALVGRWFGLNKAKGKGREEAGAVEEEQGAEETRNAVVDIFVVSNAHGLKELRVFVLYGQGVLRCFSMATDDAEKNLRLVWEWTRLNVEARKHLNIAHDDPIRAQRVFCRLQTDLSSAFLIVAMASPLGISLHQVKGVLAKTPVPRIGRHSHVLEWAPDEVQLEFALLDPVASDTAAVVACRQVPVESAVQQNALLIASVQFPSEDARRWMTRRVDDVVSGRFSVDAAASELAIITSSGVMKAFVDIDATGEDLLQRAVGKMRIKKSMNIARTFTESEATAIFGRVFRAYRDAVVNGREGMAEVQRDEDWAAMLGAITVQMLGAAVEQVSEQEVNRKPSQRWAEKWNSNSNGSGAGTGTGPRPGSFTQRLVHRMLSSRESTIKALFSFLRRTQLEERLPTPVLAKLVEHEEKVKAAIRLCALHSRASAGMTEADFSFLCRLLVQGMTGAICQREGFDTEQQVHDSLRIAGLSIPDVFYAQVTGVAEIIPFMQAITVNANDELLKLVSINRVCQAVFANNLLSREAESVVDLSKETLHWTASDDVLDVLMEQLKQGTERLANMRVEERALNTLVDQVGVLGDVLLESIRTLWVYELKQDVTLYERAKDLALLPLMRIAEVVYVEKQANAYGEKVAATALQLVERLAHKHVHFESLVRVSEVQRVLRGEANGQLLLQSGVDRYLSSMFDLDTFQDEQSASDEAKIVCFRGRFGHALAVENGVLGSVKFLDAASVSADKSALFRVQLRKDSKERTPIVRWAVESVARPGLWLSVDAQHGCRLVETNTPGVNEEFELVQAGDSPGQFRLFFEKDACVCLSATGSATTCTRPEEWKGMLTFCFVWFLKHNQAFRVAQFTENPAHAEGLQHLLSIADEILPQSEELNGLVEQLKWIHAMEMKNGQAAAQVLLQEALEEGHSLGQKKLMLSLAKLNLWAEEEKSDSRIELELDMATDTCDVLNRVAAQGERESKTTPETELKPTLPSGLQLNSDSILSMEDMVHVLLEELKIQEVGEFSYLLGMLHRERTRIELKSATSNNAKREELASLDKLKAAVWWRTLQAEYEAWKEIIEYHLESGSSEELEKRVMQTLYFRVVQVLHRERGLRNENKLREEWGVDKNFINVVLDCDHTGQVNTKAFQNIVFQNVTTVLSSDPARIA